MKIPLIKPFINEEIKQKVLQVLDSGYLTEGPVTHELENEFKNYIGCNYSIAVTSCTTGLELALRCLGIGKGNEVIVPDYTYPATASVVAIVGAKPVIVDIEKTSMLIDYNAIEDAITEKTKAIIPVSLFGNPLDYEKLNKIKKQHNLFIIEDTACSIGAEYKGIKVGKLADISVFSLHPRKFITTGEGGIITTNNKEWAEWMNSYKHFGMGLNNSREETVFKIIGTNHKLSNVQSAIGLIQMKYINELLSKRIALANNYFKLLQNIPGISIPSILPDCVHSFQSFVIFVPDRDKILISMRDIGIEVQIGTYSLHMHPAFQNKDIAQINGVMSNSFYAYANCLALPLFHDLTYEQQELVIDNLIKFL